MTAATAAAAIEHEERASIGQRMIWLAGRFRADQGQLNYPLLLSLRGPLDVDQVRQAIDALVARHEALRTTFARRDGLLTQLIHSAQPVPLATVAVVTEAELSDHIAREIVTPLDPATTPVRVTLWALDDTHHVLCLNAHHIVIDALSCRILTDEMVALLAGRPLPRVAWQYRHFAQWQHRPNTTERLRAGLSYWRGRLEGAQPTGLSRAGSRPPASAGRSRTVRGHLGATTAAKIREVARRERTTPFVVLLAIYYLTLHECGGGRDLSVAAPFANRLRPETAGTVGLFANLVILRTQLGRTGRDGSTFADVVRRTRQTVNAAAAYQDVPYYLLSMDGGAQRTDRFDDTVFQLLPEVPEPVRVGGLTVRVMPPELASRFDLELVVSAHPGGMSTLVQHAQARVADDVADELARCHHDIAAEAVAAYLALAG